MLGLGWYDEERRAARARAALRKQYFEDARENERKAVSDFEIEKKGSDFEVLLPPVYKPNPKIVIDPKPEGRKDDAAKDRFELLPGDALRAIAVILTFGAAKYGDRNWEKGMKWSRVYGALQRHLNDWWQGEALDAETGKSHLAHAGCCLLFLIAYEIRTVGEDDRPKARTSS